MERYDTFFLIWTSCLRKLADLCRVVSYAGHCHACGHSFQTDSSGRSNKVCQWARKVQSESKRWSSLNPWSPLERNTLTYNSVRPSIQTSRVNREFRKSSVSLKNGTDANSSRHWSLKIEPETTILNLDEEHCFKQKIPWSTRMVCYDRLKTMNERIYTKRVSRPALVVKRIWFLE